MLIDDEAMGGTGSAFLDKRQGIVNIVGVTSPCGRQTSQ
jgi:hypothetical protein